MCWVGNGANFSNGAWSGSGFWPFVAGQFATPAEGATATAPAARSLKGGGGATPAINTSLNPPTASDAQKIGNALLLGS